MKFYEILQSVDAKLESLRRQLARCETTPADTVDALNSVAAKIASVRQAPFLGDRESARTVLLSIRANTKNVNTLLDAATAFHFGSTFGSTGMFDTYSADGVLHPQEAGFHISFDA